jgi:lipopolysaccharide transport system ATP-binding protein
MTSAAVITEDLGKRYRLGTRLPYGRLTESISGSAKRVLRRNENGTSESRYLWALRHVDLEVGEGEVMGIIGRNGAGKTTLLKILSRITEPTEGRARFAGTVGSLLEVGTGFHPELTGRENIFLNGAVLGMHRKEIKKKFDQIVEFAEIGRFLDTPVKRFSSGMYVRLAFSVAAHLEPEVLIVDEVLAVGDIDFQKRCLGKMDDVARGGRTVLFVSHNMAAVTRLCHRAAWLANGEIVRLGPAEDIVAAYVTSGAQFEGEHTWDDGVRLPGVTELSLRSTRIVSSAGITSSIDIRDSFDIEVDYDVHEGIRGVTIGCVVKRADGVAIFETFESDAPGWSARQEPGSYRARCTVPGSLLNPGRYTVTVNCLVPGVRFFAHVPDALVFDIVDLGAHGSEMEAIQNREGVIRPLVEWTHATLGSEDALPREAGSPRT